VRWIKGLIIVIVIFVVSGEASGQNCSVTVTAIHFGNYDLFSPFPLDATTEMQIICDSNTLYTVRLDPGQYSKGNFFQRSMGISGSQDRLHYNFFRDSARTEIWGDGTDNTFTRTGTVTGGVENLTIYGRVPARQNVSVGIYHDTVTVFVEW
jgi:spore coat protein U-like protein